ncbi:Bug family tripartite tricarboxylate transporter substrate binding protein [Ottowia pentelensis]|uniref:Bug family tripartite tricarboxylate transporter substrate binding protein n=1 Tax=Ottowia pentelensis TaxID=511108 RepID=A0ABV6PRM7_9BURK
MNEHPTGISRRHTLMALAASGVSWVTEVAYADTYPSKPIRIVVPYAVGGFTDIVSRLVAQKMSIKLGQPVIVENKAGGSTIIGAEAVAKSAPDGYTLLMAVTTTISTNPFLFKKLPYKPTDFVPVALTGLTPFVLSAHPSVPANTLTELIALEKATPGTLNLATLGLGSSTHLVGEMFNALAGVKLNMIPYRGAGPALSDLIAGHVQLFFDGIATSAPLFRSGKLKGIAITGDSRSQAAPQVPTFAEAGLPDMKAASWYGLLAPARTPQAIVELLNQATNEALQSADVHARIAQDGASAPILTPQQFGDLIETHTRNWERIIKPLNISLEI